jgi:Tol biopolymer transport system component
VIRLRVIVVVAVSIVAFAPAAGSQPMSVTLAFGYPSWSHDGNRIALTGRFANGDTHLFVMNADGSGLREIDTTGDPSPYWKDYVSFPSWSPHDDQIAFSNADPELDAAGQFMGFYTTSVWVIRSDGRGLRRLVRDASAPAWSPGGARIAYTTVDELAASAIHVIRPDGTDDRTAAAPDGDQSYFDPTWSPDGERLAFAVGPAPDTGSSTYGLGISHGYGARPRLLLSGHPRRPATRAYGPAWSPSGREIAFTDSDGIALLDLRTERVKHLLRGYFPSWSPDGKRIVFVTGAFYGGSLYMINRDGSHLRLLLRVRTAESDQLRRTG